ncbi:MAG: YraN family protein [Mangrovicoccus sp.]
MNRQMAFQAGLSAEYSVARLYETAGGSVRAHRWRGKSGEIDLITEKDGMVIFTEVKTSRTIDAALSRVTPRQMARIYSAAAEFLDGEPAGQNTLARFDVAAMDRAGQIEIVENVMLH